MEKTLNRHRVWGLCAVIAGLFFIQACASMSFKPPEEALRERVDLMMNAKVADDWDVVYDLMDASYRKRVTKQNFLKMNREMVFSNYRFESLDIDSSGEKAAVKVKYDINVKVFDFKDQEEIQQWVREKGKWYLKVEKEKAAATLVE
jgi:hypothetical protein